MARRRRRQESERDLVSVAVNLPRPLKQALHHEALDLDLKLGEHIRKILERYAHNAHLYRAKRVY